jgi:methyltransferase-like protein
MTDLKSVPSRSLSVVTRKTGQEYVLVPVSNNIADMNSVYTLNETGAFIWDQIDGKKNIEEIISALISEYDIDNETATNDVILFLEKVNNYLMLNTDKGKPV